MTAARKVRPPADPVTLVEAAYDLEGSDRRWLHRICSAIRPDLDQGRGVIGLFYDSTRRSVVRPDEAVRIGAEPGDLQCLRTALDHPGQRIAPGGPHPLESLRTFGFRLGTQQGGRIRADGDADALHILLLRAVDAASPQGIVIAAPSAHPPEMTRREQAAWSKVAVHLEAGLRLRRALSAEANRRSEAAAITPAIHSRETETGDGMADPRTTLREVIRRREQGRSPGRRINGPDALNAWRALFDGRWSVVDSHERDGTRYIVARRNRGGVFDPRALSPRERQVAHLTALGHSGKAISYELGIAPSTVSDHLGSVKRKLGVRSLIELSTLLASLFATPTHRSNPKN